MDDDNNNTEQSPIEKLSQKISKRDGGPSLAELTEKNTKAIQDLSKTIDGSEQGLLGKLNPLKGLGESFGKLKDSLLQPFKNFGTALATPFKKIGSMIQSPFKALGDGVKKIKGVFGKNEEVKIKDLQLEELKGINQKMSSLVDFLTDETSEATREENAREQIARNERRHDETIQALKNSGKGGGTLTKGGGGGMLEEIVAGGLITRFLGKNKLVKAIGAGVAGTAAAGGKLLGKIPGVASVGRGLKAAPGVIGKGIKAAPGVIGKGTKAASKGVSKGVGKAALKTGLKSAVKKIPFIGAVAGLGFGLQRALGGDFVGAAGEVASGAASIVPGLGTAASVAIDGALLAKDVSSEAKKDAKATESAVEVKTSEASDTAIKKPGFFSRIFGKKEKDIDEGSQDFIPKGFKQSEFEPENYQNLKDYAENGYLFAQVNKSGKPRANSPSAMRAGETKYDQMYNDVASGNFSRKAYVGLVNAILRTHKVVKKKEYVTEAQMIQAGIMPPRKDLQAEGKTVPIPTESVTGEKTSGADLSQASQSQQQADQALSDFESSGKEFEMVYDDDDFDQEYGMRQYKNPEDQKKYEQLRMDKFDAEDSAKAAREQITGKTDADKINFLKSKGVELEGFEYGDSTMGSDGKEVFDFKGKLKGDQLDSAMDQYFNAQALTPAKDDVGKQLIADGAEVEMNTSAQRQIGERQDVKAQTTLANSISQSKNESTVVNNSNQTINNSNHLDAESKAKYMALVST